MQKAYLLIGSNMGNRRQNLIDALMHIENYAGKILKFSSVYETAAWGNPDQQSFFNQAVLIDTLLEADMLMHELLSIERLMGRKRTPDEQFAPRLIDIDILFFNNASLKSKIVTIPHPRLHERNFALKPMLELAPEFMHPVIGKNIEQIAKSCLDKSSAVIIS